MNEAETKAKLVEKKLEASGWNEEKISREFYYNKDYTYTEGRIILIGSKVKRGRRKRIDYLLRYTDGFPIAVVEVKSVAENPESALEQAKDYAKDLGLAFAYSTNGYKIIEYDFFTNTSTLLENFPTPQELWNRWKINTGLSEPIESNLVQVGRVYGYNQSSINPLTYPYYIQEGKEPRYYQERAIREIIVGILKGKKRILLTMATGTGKTFVAFQVVWKLLKSEHFLKIGRPGRVLFLADRIFLRNQAYNTFSPFSDKNSDPRYLIEGHPIKLNRQIYFGIYQTLWTEDDKKERLYQKFPRDFFDLVIIDECHRSGWGTWREILDHFESAIHLGMTATPKRKDNVDTYAYFGEPVYEYSLSQGIEDGFLATYRVHRVLTTIDKEGLNLEDAIEQGAEVFIPEDVEPRSKYTTSQFEREITLPDRTKKMVKHLANLLRKYGPMEKTIVFCVNMEHARQVAMLLQNELGPELNIDKYAVPIISEEKEMALEWLEDFASSDSPTPVIAVTAELLSTGIDVPPCKNIVFMKTVSSPVLFKQIIGR
ncbi:MAG: DEAD/DEAH box helicase family protein [candidate division WOR-3 bacterium]|nr:DEAD/DEAH box helicase family protein [candidate division WOR-3 bacterium]